MLGLLAEAPALPLGTGGKYVAAAYIAFVVLLVIYVAIMASKLQRIERELRELASFAEAGGDKERQARDAVAESGTAAVSSEGAQSAPDSLASSHGNGGGAAR